MGFKSREKHDQYRQEALAGVRDVAQSSECLASMLKALSSIPSSS